MEQRILLFILFPLLIIGCTQQSSQASQTIDCQAKSGQNARNICFLTMALQEGQIEICEKIIENDSLGQIKDSCYSNIAAKNGDGSICTNVENPKFADLCQTLVSQANEDCSAKSQISAQGSISEGDMCVYTRARLRLESDECALISDQNIRDLCFRDVAKYTFDTSLCEKLSNSEPNFRRDECLAVIAGTNGDKTLCSRINSRYKKTCETGADMLNSN